MEEAGDSVYADLLRYYGVDLSDMVSDRPTLSPAKVIALVENLPMEAATTSRLRDTDDGVGWGVNSYLLAAVFDAVRENTYANMQVRTKKKLPVPERLSVPGAAKEKKANSFMQMAKRHLANQRR